MSAYKILDKETGLYAKGGQYDQWSKVGKTWASASGLSKHLRCRDGRYSSKQYVVQMWDGAPSRELTVEDYRKEVTSRSHTKPRG